MGNEALFERTPQRGEPTLANGATESHDTTAMPARDLAHASPGSSSGSDGSIRADSARSARADAVLLKRVQRSNGNRHVQRLLGDAASSKRSVMRSCSCGSCEQCRANAQANAPPDMTDPSRRPVQSRMEDGRDAADAHVESELIPSASAGVAMDNDTRDAMASRFGRNFDDVRVHTDSHAASATEALGAQAFTAGRDLYFAPGRYAPDTREGGHLLAHELAHTVQQADGAMPTRIAAKAHDGTVIGSADDPLEAEADRIAEQVMTATEPQPVHVESARRSVMPSREEGRKTQQEDMSGRARPSPAHAPTARGAGQSLSASIRNFFEPRIGMDLGNVRVHTDGAAGDAAKSIGARAFTFGSDIAFARNQFAPETPDGKRLLAHELAHVRQQSDESATRRIARKEDEDAPAPKPSKETAVSHGPIGPTITFEGEVLAANAEYLEPILQNYIAAHGEGGANQFAWRLRRHIAEQVDKSEIEDLDVDDPIGFVAADLKGYSAHLPEEAKVVIAVDETLGRIRESNRQWLADFEAKAKEVVLGMLTESEDRVNQERIRYGIEWWEVQYTGYTVTKNDRLIETKEHYTEYSMQDTPGSRALGLAATGIVKRKEKFDEADKNMEEFGDSINASLGQLSKERYGVAGDPDLIRLNELRAVRNLAKRDLDVYRMQKTAEFPILAAYASEEKISESKLNQLQMLAYGKGPLTGYATNMMAREIKTRLEHINDARTDILENGGKKTKIWRVPRIIEGTRTITGATPGTMHGRLVDDKVKDEAPGILTSILIGLLQLVLVLLAPVTGGLTLLPAAAISVGQAYSSFREYERAQMLHGTDFGAMALSSEEPSLFWLAVDIIGAGFDVGAAAGAAVRLFKALAPGARAARAARGVEAIEEEARKVERTARELGGERLAKAVGKDARAGSEAAHVGETLDEAKALERAGQQFAEVELRTDAAVAESIAGRKVTVSASGALWSCASPCTLLRERYRGLLQRNKAWESKVKELEDEAARITKGKKGSVAARQDIADRAAALEKEMRTHSLPGDWTSPLEDSKKYAELLERRGSAAAKLDHHPPDWTGKDEALFRYGHRAEAEPHYRWTLDEEGALRYDRLDASRPPHRFNTITRKFEEAGEDGLIRAIPGTEETHALGDISKKQREAMEEAFKKRGKLITERDRLEVLEEAGKISKKDAEKLSKVHAQINEQSRQLGENAAESVMKGRGGKKVYPLSKTHSASGDFDQVWKVGGEFELVEAKGGSSALGSRAVGEGLRAEQGTVAYAKSIAENMAKHGATKEIRKLGEELLVAIAKGKVKYILVRAPIGTELGSAVLRDVRVSEFVL